MSLYIKLYYQYMCTYIYAQYMGKIQKFPLITDPFWPVSELQSA